MYKSQGAVDAPSCAGIGNEGGGGEMENTKQYNADGNIFTDQDHVFRGARGPSPPDEGRASDSMDKRHHKR
jgi:hypothetical protein